MTQVIVVNTVTGANELITVPIPIPLYEIGTHVEFGIGKDIPGTDSGTVTGFRIHVTQLMGGEIMTQVDYEIDNSIHVTEEEIEGYWPIDEDSPEEAV